MANNSVNKTNEQTIMLIKLWDDEQTLNFHEARRAWSRNCVTKINTGSLSPRLFLSQVSDLASLPSSDHGMKGARNLLKERKREKSNLLLNCSHFLTSQVNSNGTLPLPQHSKLLASVNVG